MVNSIKDFLRGDFSWATYKRFLYEAYVYVISPSFIALFSSSLSDQYLSIVILVYIGVIYLLFFTLHKIYPFEKYLDKKGSSNFIWEITISKYYFYVGIIVILVLMSIFIYEFKIPPPFYPNSLSPDLTQSQEKDQKTQDSNFFSEYLKSVLGTTINLAIWIVYVRSISYWTNSIFRKDFRYYVAKAHLRNLLNVSTDVLKLRHFTLGLNQYDVYLSQNLDLRIKNMQKFYSVIASASPSFQDDSLKKIAVAFEMKDHLQPLREVLAIMTTSGIKNDLVKPLKKNDVIIKDWGAFISGLVASLITLVTTIKWP